MHALKVDIRIQRVEHKPWKLEKSILDHFSPYHSTKRELSKPKETWMSRKSKVWNGELAAQGNMQLRVVKITRKKRRNWNDMGDLVQLANMEVVHLVIRCELSAVQGSS